MNQISVEELINKFAWVNVITSLSAWERNKTELLSLFSAQEAKIVELEKENKELIEILLLKYLEQGDKAIQLVENIKQIINEKVNTIYNPDILPEIYRLLREYEQSDGKEERG